MTEYHDEDYRQRKLSRFRKKRELDVAKAELEREDQMELEERSHRAQTAVSPPNNAFSPKVLRRASIATLANPKMPPPSLPLQSRRESNSDGARDIASLPKAATPTLKRQHAELDTDARPTEKFARTDTNGNRTRGSSPATSIKGEPVSIFSFQNSNPWRLFLGFKTWNLNYLLLFVGFGDQAELQSCGLRPLFPLDLLEYACSPQKSMI